MMVSLFLVFSMANPLLTLQRFERALLDRARAAFSADVAAVQHVETAIIAKPGSPFLRFHAPPRAQQNTTPATQGPDQLRMRVWSQYGFVQVVLTLRARQSDGSTAVSQTSLVTANSPAGVAEVFVDAGGELISASIVTSTQSINVARGDVFAQLDYARKINGVDTSVATLLQGYVARNASLAWPGSPIQSPYEGPGRPLSRIYSSGALGQNSILIFVPTGLRFRIIDIKCLLTTDATAINRTIALIFGDQAVGVIDGLFTQNISGVIGPSQTAQVTWGSGASSHAVDPNGTHWLNISMPNDVYFVSGDRLTIFVSGLQPGDQITGINLRAEQWLDPQ